MIFGTNEIVGKKYFNDAQDQLLVTSMFYTLQGEGPYRGVPAFFVRLAKCNLACSFCDTYFDHGDWWRPNNLLKQTSLEIDKYFNYCAPSWAKYIPGRIEETKYGAKVYPTHRREMVLVLTGGEPMLQKNIVPFLEMANIEYDHTQIESNGLVWQDIPKQTTLVVSPKCHEKDGKATHYLQPNKQVLDRADCLKFVMEESSPWRNAEGLYSPYSSIPEWADEWHQRTGKQIFVSPMNVYLKKPYRDKNTDMSKRNKEEVISFWSPGLLDMQVNERNHRWVAKYCLEHGYTMNLQIHLFAGLA